MSSHRAKPTLPPDQLTVVWQSVSLLLDYPDEAVLGRAALEKQIREYDASAARTKRSGFADTQVMDDTEPR